MLVCGQCVRSVCEVRTVVCMWSECGLAVWLHCAVRTYRFNTELLFRLQQQDRLVDGPDGAERARRSLQAQGRLLPRELLRQREAQRNLHTNTHHYVQSMHLHTVDVEKMTYCMDGLTITVTRSLPCSSGRALWGSPGCLPQPLRWA